MKEIIGATGHRPHKLGGYSDDIINLLTDIAVAYLMRYGDRVDRAISGLALGWDTAVALASLHLNIPLIAAVPFEGQESRWPEHSQRRYRKILKRCDTVKYVCGEGYAPWKMQQRNIWMVDNSTRMCSLWDGSPGGTANCIAYAKLKNVPIDPLWPKFEEARKHS